MTTTGLDAASVTYFTAGLVSITFRQLSPERVVDLVSEAGLQAIEWGGDVHAPPDQPERAAAVRELTERAGLSVAAYGSYYRAGWSAPSEFSDVLRTARILGSPTIRVWAGKKGSGQILPAEKRAVIDDLKRVAALAAEEDVVVACEYHQGTLTDSEESAAELMRETDDDGVRCYWQPLHGTPVQQRERGLRKILPQLRNIHVYNWHPETRERLPLAESRKPWLHWLGLVAEQGPGGEVACLLEFVRNDAPENFIADARTLREWLAEFA